MLHNFRWPSSLGIHSMNIVQIIFKVVHFEIAGNMIIRTVDDYAMNTWKCIFACGFHRGNAEKLKILLLQPTFEVIVKACTCINVFFPFFSKRITSEPRPCSSSDIHGVNKQYNRSLYFTIDNRNRNTNNEHYTQSFATRDFDNLESVWGYTK